MYRYGIGPCIIQESTGWGINPNSSPEKYRAFEEWIAAGNTVNPEQTFEEAYANYRVILTENIIGSAYAECGLGQEFNAVHILAATSNPFQEAAQQCLQHHANVIVAWLEFLPQLKQAYQDGLPPPLNHEQYQASLPAFCATE